MAVAHAPAGFTGTVDQGAWSKLMGMATTRFRVASSTDWLVAANTGATRTVTVAAGSGFACGVNDSTTAQDSLTFTANGGGSTRYDAVVATFDWSANSVTFQVIAGTTSPPAVNTTTSVVTTKINRIPGTRYDAVLAIVQVRSGVGAFSAGDVFDCRMWGGYSGPMTGTKELTTAMLGVLDGLPGSEVVFPQPYNRRWRYDASTSAWQPGPNMQALVMGGGWTAVSGHVPRATVNPDGTVRMAGWVQNATQYSPNFDAIVLSLPSTLPPPLVQQSYNVAYASPTAGFGLVACSMLPSGQLRTDIVINGTGPVPIPANSSFFLDSISYHTTYSG